MKIAILAAGAGGMYCGSCMRDNALAVALIRGGHAATLVPLYTPLRTDAEDVSIGQVFYGGINVYLQHSSRVFRHTPRAIDWLLDRPWLLRKAARRGAATDPADLGPLTVSVARGEHGPTRKELDRLVRFLADHVGPDVICLPNAMFLGVAGTLKRELGAPVVCELAGEDIFLDALTEPHRSEVLAILGERAADADGFTSASRYYADYMSGYLGIERGRIEVVYPGVRRDDYPPAPERPSDRPPTVGYLARVCPAKGLDRLLDGMAALRARAGFESAAVRSAGWLGPGDADWFAALLSERAVRGPLSGAVTHLGEVDRAGKLGLLHGIDVFSVPTAYAESKGIYVLEALAAGVPVVQPAHGSFPELIEATGGGLLVAPGDAEALADGLARLLADPDLRAALARAGRTAVLERFTDDRMAEAMVAVFNRALGRQQRPGIGHRALGI